MKLFIKLAGICNVVFGSVFLIYWGAYGIALPVKELKTSIIPLVSDPDWVWVNTIGLTGTLFGVIGLTGLHYLQIDKKKFYGTLGFVLGVFGIILLGGQLLWETFVWKILVNSNSILLNYDGPVFTNKPLLGVTITGGLAFSIGYLLVGFACRLIDYLPNFGIQLFILGAPLFGLGPLFGPLQQIIRAAGIVLFAAGIIWTGLRMAKIKQP
jgi:hypothetical protein